MKKLIKVLALSLIVGLFGVVAVSSLVASPGEIQSPQTVIKFTAPSGIRWNQGKEGGSAFEIFNAAGFSYIASGYYINADGEYSSSSTGVTAGVQATGDKVYHIMQDIPYVETDAMNPAFKGGTSQVSGYPGPRFKILAGGVINGRGCTISGFPIRAGSALFESNAGTILNLKVQNATFSNTSTSGTEIGLIAKTNTGIIDDCEIKTGTLNVSDASIGAIAYESNGSGAIIKNCLNDLAITTTGTLSAGIVASTTGGEILRNINNAAITGANAAGIVALSDDNTQIKSNSNHGNITGSVTACGILASGKTTKYNNHENISANTNGELVVLSGAGEKAEIYIGMPESESGGSTSGGGSGTLEDPYTSPKGGNFGIYYHADGVFLVTNEQGLSYVGKNVTFNTLGAKESKGTYAATKTTAKYYITQDITYVGNYFTAVITLGENGLLDGQNKQLKGFPIKSAGGALFGTIPPKATVRNINLTTSSDSVTAVAGILCYENQGRIENCTVGTTGNAIVTNSMFGGIAAMATAGIFIDCVNNASVTSTSWCLGGVVGYSLGAVVLLRCVNNFGTMLICLDYPSAGLSLGGIAGVVSVPGNSLCGLPEINSTVGIRYGAIVMDCNNQGSLYGESGFALGGKIGGVVGGAGGDGEEDKYNFVGCQNLGEGQSRITGENYVIMYAGGIVGYAGGQDGDQFYFESSFGRVLKNTMPIVMGTSSYVGGIVGSINRLTPPVFRTPDWASDVKFLTGSNVGAFNGNVTNFNEFIDL